MNPKNPFKLIESKHIYKNNWISLREDAVVRPGGEHGIFGVTTMRPGVTVVALTKNLTVLMVREFKYGHDNYTLECVAGCIDDGEAAVDAAARELREEVGATTDTLIDLGSQVTLPTLVHLTNQVFLAKDVIQTHEQDTDSGEVIEVVEMPFDEAIEKVMQGTIVHDLTCLALLKTKLHLGL